MIFFGIASLVFVPFTVDAAASGNTTRAVYGVLGVLVGLTFVGIALPSLRVRRKRLPEQIILDGAAGLRFSLVRYSRATLAVWLVVGIAFIAARAVMVSEDLFTGDDPRVGLDVLQLVVALAVIVAFAFLIVYLFAGHRDNHVTLGHGGVVRVSGPVTKSISWDDIALVSPRVANEMAMVRIVPTTGSAFHVDTGNSRMARWGRQRTDRWMDLPALAFGVDPALLLYLVRFYQQHPDDRYELQSNAVLDRIQGGELLG
ncbi:hypothetical protein [Nocardia jejuensis]|uniref:hypothetical protein n=1 Tax=Nocardia jejuensis TaxID=328049 RepID=UPI0012FA7D06|nr:hypothetical protein [Nocardia jejuensis]